VRIAALAAAALVPGDGHARRRDGGGERVHRFQKKLDQDLGSREAKTLTDALTRKIDNAFNSAGVNAARVVVTIEDAQAEPSELRRRIPTSSASIPCVRSASVAQRSSASPMTLQARRSAAQAQMVRVRPLQRDRQRHLVRRAHIVRPLRPSLRG